MDYMLALPLRPCQFSFFLQRCVAKHRICEVGKLVVRGTLEAWELHIYKGSSTSSDCQNAKTKILSM